MLSSLTISKRKVPKGRYDYRKRIRCASVILKGWHFVAGISAVDFNMPSLRDCAYIPARSFLQKYHLTGRVNRFLTAFGMTASPMVVEKSDRTALPSDHSSPNPNGRLSSRTQRSGVRELPYKSNSCHWQRSGVRELRWDEVAPRPGYGGKLNLPKYSGQGITLSEHSPRMPDYKSGRTKSAKNHF